MLKHQQRYAANYISLILATKRMCVFMILRLRILNKSLYL